MKLSQITKFYVGMKALALTGLFSCLSPSAFAQSEPCKIRFKTDSIEYNASDLRSCENLLADGSVKEILIRGFASPPGTKEYNLDLSKRRAENLEMVLKGRYPNVTVRALGEGENAAIGKSARVFALDELGNPAGNESAKNLNAIVNPMGVSLARREKKTDWSWLGALGLLGFFPLLKRNLRHSGPHHTSRI